MDGEWEIFLVDEVREWINGLDEAAIDRITKALTALARGGPQGLCVLAG